ncbi:integrase arm-type DNA-binding domain-containing protein [Desulfovibrio sp. OttesenSCG-928-A18]|nr:integrase arm-type DNA-binding domain-containing protein [Desulfovibrio sp. OttesenSCG-928-A18]
MKLTDTFVRNLKALGEIKKYSDGEGLYLHLSPTGGKLWRMGYRFGGKQKTLSLGAYPAVGLKDARKRRDEAKAMIAAGVDPGEQKKAAKAALIAAAKNTFEAVAREWHALQSPKWVESHRANILSGLQKDFFPHIGRMPIGDVTASVLLSVLRRIEARNAPKTAKKMRQTCGQIFRYAIATGRAERDPAVDLRDALTPVRTKSFASLKDPQAIGALLRNIDAYEGNIIVRSALQMAPYVFVRPGELRRAEWAEFILEGETPEWRIPAERMKMKAMHLVPLSRQVVAILEVLRPYSQHSRYLFPSMRAASAPISDMTLLGALRRLGYTKDEMTVHGFRSMASTLLNEQGYNRDWIERQLAHGERNSVRAAYNYAEYLPERRRMMQEWADYLDELRAEAGSKM